MVEPQPELRWAPLPPQPKRTGRVWLIIGLVVAVLAIVGALLFFLLPRGDSPTPAASSSPSPTTSTGQTPSDSPSTEPQPSEPSEPSTATPPPANDQTIEVFRGKVSGWLNDALRGLDIVAGASGQDALPVVETLQQDAQRLSDVQPPSSMDRQWRDGVSAYAERLDELASAISGGADVGAAADAARAEAQELRSLVGL